MVASNAYLSMITEKLTLGLIPLSFFVNATERSRHKDRRVADGHRLRRRPREERKGGKAAAGEGPQEEEETKRPRAKLSRLPRPGAADGRCGPRGTSEVGLIAIQN